MTGEAGASAKPPMMSTDERDHSEYFQTIAREFLKKRGGALFLSPRELGAIAGWEARGIPVRVVLEGIERTFEAVKKKSRSIREISLTFCDREVGRAWDQDRDRSAGRRAKSPLPSDKRDRARLEVERALKSLPSHETELIPLFESAFAALSADQPDEEALERTESAVEEILYARATPDEKARLIREVGRDLAAQGPEDVEAASRTKIIKTMRTKLKIPYVSLYYY